MAKKSQNAGGRYAMNTFFAYLIPAIFLLSFLLAFIKRIKIYDSFTTGASKAFPLVVAIFPYLAVITMLARLVTASGLEERLLSFLSPVLEGVGIPKELAGLLLLKPLSGSGSIAMLSDLLETYGVDSYLARCACVAYGSSETIFYVAAVYFAGIKRKKLTIALLFALLSYLLSVVFCCFLCRFL